MPGVRQAWRASQGEYTQEEDVCPFLCVPQLAKQGAKADAERPFFS